jgi:hypothetical protein
MIIPLLSGLIADAESENLAVKKANKKQVKKFIDWAAKSGCLSRYIPS